MRKPCPYTMLAKLLADLMIIFSLALIGASLVLGFIYISIQVAGGAHA